MKRTSISRMMAVALVIELGTMAAPAIWAAPPMDVVTIHYAGVIDSVDDPDGHLDGSVAVGDIFYGSYTFNTTGAEVRHVEPGWDIYDYYAKAPAGMTMSVSVGNCAFETAEDVELSGFIVRNNYGSPPRDEYDFGTGPIIQTAGPDLGLVSRGLMPTCIDIDLTTRANLDVLTSTALPRTAPPWEKFELTNRFSLFLALGPGGGDSVVVTGHLAEVPTVPGVVGWQLEEATRAITFEGLSVGEVDYDYSVTFPEGCVISTDPPGGTPVAPGSEVDLVVSLGPAGPGTVLVPDVVGKGYAAAQADITGVGLTVGTTAGQYSDTILEGTIISQDPPGGTSVALDSEVDLVVSLGPAGPGTVLVPDVVGKGYAAAQADITGAGLSVGTTAGQYSDSILEGTIISQDPAAGASVVVGSQIQLVMSLGPSSGQLDLGLVAHYTFEGNARDSVGTNHGVEVGNPTYASGVLGQAIDLDGIGDYVDCGNGEAFDMTGAITVASWVQIRSIVADWSPVVAKGDSAWRLSTTQREGRFHFAVTGDPGYFSTTGEMRVGFGEWHHVAGTYDGANIRLYVDGALDTSTPYAGGIATNAYPVCVGENIEVPGRYWDGLIDEVRIYSRALTSHEILKLATPETGPADTEPGQRVCLTESTDVVGFDIGGALPPGTADPRPTMCWEITGGGADIWGTADQFYFLAAADPESPGDPWMIEGDFTAIVGIKTLGPDTTAADWAKAGIMARASVSPGSAQAMIVRSLRMGAAFQGRDFANQHSWHVPMGVPYGRDDWVWVRLDRVGNAFTSSCAVGGVTPPTVWASSSPRGVPLPSAVMVGLAVSSLTQGVPIMATCTDLCIGPYLGPPAIAEPELPEGSAGGPGYMSIREVIDNGDIRSQGDCFASLNSGVGTIVEYQAPVLNIQDSGGQGDVGSDDVFGVVAAGHRAYGAVEDLSLLARGTVRIPPGQDGDYTFGVNSDDGFTLQFVRRDFVSAIDGQIVRLTSGAALQFFGDRAAAATLGVIHLPAGDHEFWLTYHEGWGSAAVELYAARGNHAAFTPGVFHLVGEPGGLQLAAP